MVRSLAINTSLPEGRSLVKLIRTFCLCLGGLIRSILSKTLRRLCARLVVEARTKFF